MSNPLYAFPAVCEQTLRALARYPERTAFSWPGGSITYRGASDMIGRIQSVFMQLGFAPGTRVAFLTANRADTWCAGCAAQLSRFAITWLHPLGSLDDQLFQLEDSEAQMLVVDGVTFRDRGGELAAKATSLKTVSRSARPITALISCRQSRPPAAPRRAALPAPTISPR
jgi:fatty-acyl-CoA synthase